MGDINTLKNSTTITTIQSLADRPLLASTTALKAKFDESPEDIRQRFNNLVDYLLKNNSSDDGASNIGIDNPNGNTVKEVIDYILTLGTGTLPPDDSITNAKMNSTVKLGLLSDLNTNTKSSFVAAINELVTTINSSAHKIPSGLIAKWHGLISNIPTGWVLCDGNNGTPNLSDKFIMGTTSQTTMNTTGGSNSVTLTTNELPAHDHDFTATGGEHSHDYDHPADSTYLPSTQAPGNPSSITDNYYTGTTGSSGTLTITGTTDTTGSGNSFDNRPSYYALAFIMKL